MSFFGLAIATIVGCATTPSPQAQAPGAPAAARFPANEPKDSSVDYVSMDVDDADLLDGSPSPDLTSQDDTNLWTRIRAGLYKDMPPFESPLIARHERWFVEHAEFREAMIERAKLYLYYIVEEVEKRGMPMEIALLPAIESAYKPYAYSRARASGLWQFMPSTGRLYGLKGNWWYDGRRDVIASTRAALDYLQKLHDDFDGDWHLAIAAYNAGEGRIGRAIKYNQRKGLPTTLGHLRQIKAETKNYVPKLMAMANIVSDPARYGIALADIPNEPYFATVDTGSQVDLGVVAKLTGMPVDQLHHINAGYTRWTTDPDGPHHVLVPVDKRDALVAGLSSLPEADRVQWQQHEVKKGETLYSIARRYDMTANAIRIANKLTSNTVRVGQALMLPISANAVLPKFTNSRSIGTRPLMHRVRAGETLYGIARRYGVLVQQLLEWNPRLKGSILQRGQRLRLSAPAPRR